MLARWVGPGADAPLAGAPDFACRSTARAPTRSSRTTRRSHDAVAGRAVAESEAKVAQADRDPDWSVEVTSSAARARATGT